MQVTLKAKNQTYAFAVQDGESLLYAGARAGLELPYGCATGTCGTCRVRSVRGNCIHAWPDAPGRRGQWRSDDILLCQSMIKDDVELETDKFIYRADPGACLPAYRMARIEHWRQLAPDMLGLTLALDHPFSYEAGQFVALTVPGIAGFRVYSITNFARTTRSIDLLIKRKPGGGFTEWLFGAKSMSTPIRVFGPLGRATFSPAHAKDLLVIAGGSGIAGMMSILARAVQEGYFARHRGYVFFGVRTWTDRFYLDEFSAMRAAFPDQLQVTVALSDEEIPAIASESYPHLGFDRGFVHEVARDHMSGKYGNLRAYVAGPPPAVDATLRYLVRDAKLSPNEIRYDKFA